VYLGLIAYLRELLCRGNTKVIENIIEAGLYPSICKMSTALEYEDLMVEITWVLTNLTSTEDLQIMDFMLDEQYGLVKYLGSMIKHPNLKVKEHALW
jgi:hypothetical protein